MNDIFYKALELIVSETVYNPAVLLMLDGALYVGRQRVRFS